MFNPSPQNHRDLLSLNAGYRLAHRAPTLRPRPGGDYDQTDQGCIYCEIFDLTIDPQCRGRPYASATGGSEPEALNNAIEAAKVADKPMTPAQAATAANRRVAAVASENAELKSKTASLEGEVSRLERELAAARGASAEHEASTR